MKDDQPEVALFGLDHLIKESIHMSIKLIEYFKLNLIYYQLVSGKGLEFDKLREYIVGDDVRRIDWKILARTKKLYIRAYKEERNYDIIFVFDVSNSMLLGTADMTKNQFSSVAMGALAFAALEAGDNIGLVMSSDKVQQVLEPQGEFAVFMKFLADKQNYGGQKDWGRITNDIIANFDRDSIIFVFSDFIDTDPQVFLPELAANFAKVYGIMVRDPLDDEIPKGVGRMYLRDAHGGSFSLADLDKAREEYAELARRHVKRVKDRFHAYGQLFFKVETGEDFGTGFIKAVGAEQVIEY